MPQPNWYPDFQTHHNYVTCLNGLSGSLSLNVNIPALSPSTLTQPIQSKTGLAELTLQSMQQELVQVQSLHDYAQICVSWIPVKAYYLYFNLNCLLLTLLEEDEQWLSASHTRIANKVRTLLGNHTIQFSESAFNSINVGSTIIGWNLPRGENVRVRSVNLANRQQQIKKKLLAYAMEEYKRLNSLKQLRNPRRARFLQSHQFSLCDFFYWYRIKANYKDMEFVSRGVSISDFYDFYTNYFQLITNFYNAYKPQINQMSQQKFGQNLLNI